MVIQPLILMKDPSSTKLYKTLILTKLLCYVFPSPPLTSSWFPSLVPQDHRGGVFGGKLCGNTAGPAAEIPGEGRG